MFSKHKCGEGSAPLVNSLKLCDLMFFPQHKAIIGSFEGHNNYNKVQLRLLQYQALVLRILTYICNGHFLAPPISFHTRD